LNIETPKTLCKTRDISVAYWI